MLASFFTTEILASFIPKYNTCQCVAVGISLPEHPYPLALCQGITLHGHSSWGGWPVPPLSLEAMAGEWTSPVGDPPAPSYSPVPWRVYQCPISDESGNSHADSRHRNTGAALEITSDLFPRTTDPWPCLLERAVLSSLLPQS